MAIVVPIVASWNPIGLNKAIADIKRAEGALNKFTVGSAALGGVMQSTGRQLTRNLTVPLALVSGAAIKSAMDFEDSFGKIEGLVGVAKSDLQELKNAAKTLGPTYGQSANEAADALFFITSAGIRGKDAIDVLERSLKASAVGLGDAKTIADLTTSAMNAYGIKVLDASQATDVLTAAVRLGKLEPAELAGSIGQVLPLASALGISFDQVGATFAAMSRTGTDAATAATQLRGIMSGLTKVTPKAEKQLAAFGLSGEELRRQLKDEGLLSVLQTLTSTFGDNEVAIANVFGNVRALTGVIDLMGSNVASTNEIFAEMADSTGILDEAFGVTADTTKFKFAQAMADLKVVLLEIGEVLIPVFVDTVIPAIRDVAESFKDLVEKFKALSPETQDAIVKFGLLLVVAGPILFFVGSLVKLLGPLVTLIFNLGKALMFLTLNPIGAVILGIAALIALIIYLIKNWDKVKESAVNAMKQIKDHVLHVKDFVVQKITELGAFIIENHPLLKLFRAVKEFAPTVIEWFKNLGSLIMDGFRDGIIAAASRALDAIRNTMQAGADIAKKLLRISSPSRVFADIGKNVMQGYVNGIESMSNAVNATMSSMAMDSTIALNGSVETAAAGSNAGSGGNTYNINVNAGMGTNGAQVGKEIVDAIKRFEKTSGPVFAGA